jgi:hypothetical protein
MTVGQALQRLTGLRLFHNHMTIDLALRFFDWGTPAFGRLSGTFRTMIFEEVAASDLPGMIFTYVWALDDPRDKEFVDRVCAIFRMHDAEVYFVELESTQAERLRRNETEHRLAEKWPKRDVERSRTFLLEADSRYRLNSSGDTPFPYPDPSRYVKIDNTDLSPDETAGRIVEAFPGLSS